MRTPAEDRTGIRREDGARSSRSGAPWLAVVVEVPEGIEDEMAGLLGAGSLGVEVVPGREGTTALRVCLPSDGDVSAATTEATRALRGRGLDPSRIRVEPIEDGRWVERYRASRLPLPLGERFLVLPGDAPTENPGRRPIVVVPGRAFGTGEHPTTRLSAEALERWVRPASRWLDLGTGSGILAVVAVRCGAASVTAVDVDPDAVEAAAETARANGVEDSVAVVLGTAEDVRDRGYDGCVANVTAPLFLSHASDLRAVVRGAGMLLASGFLEDDTASVAAALRESGFSILERREEAGWSLLAARRDG